LRSAILAKDFKQALFWAYELYRSGFQSEVIEFMLELFDKHYSGFPRLRRTFIEWYEQWKVNPKEQDVFLGSIIKNMCIRSFENPRGKTEQNFIVVLRRDQIEMHDTQPLDIRWKYLRDVYKYPVTMNETSIEKEKQKEKQKDLTEFDEDSDKHQTKNETENQNQKNPVGYTKKEIIKAYRENWLYFANYSPIWAIRIKKFSNQIIIHHEKKQVQFPTEDLEEAFMDKYNYEPDEQPKHIQQGAIGITL